MGEKRHARRNGTVTRCGAATACLLAAAVSRADYLTDVGATALWAVHPELKGNGVIVAQGEATTFWNNIDSNDFEVNPATVNTTAPIEYINSAGSVAFSFPNNIGLESGHGDGVGQHFYGATTGTAPGVALLLNYNANYLVDKIIFPNIGMSAQVVNQSFIDPQSDAAANATEIQLYDNYVATHGTIIVSGNGNGGGPQPPATAYNVIAVGDYDGASSVGPTSDGRSKPDIVAPSGQTSFSTPFVSGIAALMVQAGSSGVGGNPAAAVDPRTVKAILLNGSSKFSWWTHTATQPLDAALGAGVVNAYNSYQNLAAGQKGAAAVNASQAPIAAGASVGTAGWDLATVSNATSVAHYYMDLSQATTMLQLTSTLVWERPAGNVVVFNNPDGSVTYAASIMGINNLFLLIYNVDSGTVVDQSISPVDNVQHLYTVLSPGRYDLEVVKTGNSVSATETYAMAFNNAATASNDIVNNLAWNITSGSRVIGALSGSGTTSVSAGASLSASSIRTPAAAGTLVVNGTVIIRATTSPSNGSLVSILQIGGVKNAWTGTLDITNNVLVVEANANKAAVLAQLENQVMMGRLTGLGIIGSGLPANETIAVVDNEVLGRTTFGGLNVDSNSVLLTDALWGDANLDGVVTGADYTIWADHYGMSGQSWATGDFNGDGLVSGADYTLWADHYGMTLAGQMAGIQAGFSVGGGPVDIPEPGSLALLGLGGVAMMRRRR